MSATITVPISEKVANTRLRRRIEAAAVGAPGTDITLQVLHGPNVRRVRFNQEVGGNEVTTFAAEQYGWKNLDKMNATMDGKTYTPEEWARQRIKPETPGITFDGNIVPTVEFHRPAPGKG